MLRKQGTECVCVVCSKRADPGDPPLCDEHRDREYRGPLGMSKEASDKLWDSKNEKETRE